MNPKVKKISLQVREWVDESFYPMIEIVRWESACQLDKEDSYYKSSTYFKPSRASTFRCIRAMESMITQEQGEQK